MTKPFPYWQSPDPAAAVPEGHQLPSTNGHLHRDRAEAQVPPGSFHSLGGNVR